MRMMHLLLSMVAWASRLGGRGSGAVGAHSFTSSSMPAPGQDRWAQDTAVPAGRALALKKA